MSEQRQYLNTPPDTPPVHWPRGGSVMPLLVHCHGCVNECAKHPPAPSGESAIDGTHSHAALAWMVDNRILDAADYVGQWFIDHEGEFRLDEDRAGRIQVALDYLKTRHQPHQELFVELFVDAGRPFDIPDCGGSIDLAIVDFQFSTVEVIDYKDGFRDVPADTPQLILYAQGLLNRYPNFRPKTVRRTVIQPRDFGNPVKTLEQSAKVFFDDRDGLLGAVRLSMRDDAPLVSGPWCVDHFCDAAMPGRCPAFGDKVAETIDLAFQGVPEPGAVDPAVATLPRQGGKLSPDEMAAVLDGAALVKSWLDDIEAQALKDMMSGVVVPRYKVVRGQSRRKFAESDTETLIAKFKRAGLKKGDYTKESVKTPNQIMGSETFKGWTERKQKNFEALIVKPPGALKITPMSDPTPGIIEDTATTFKDVPDAPAAGGDRPPPIPSNDPPDRQSVEPEVSFL